MGCFRLLLEYLVWIEHRFLSGIGYSRKAGSLCGMMWGVGGVRKSIHQSWLDKGLGLGLLWWGFKRVQEEIPWEEASAPCDFWLFPKPKEKLRGCRYETIKGMKEAVTKVIDTLTQSCMNRASVFEWYKRFNEGRESVVDDERCGRSKEVNTPELIGQRVRVRVTMMRF